MCSSVETLGAAFFALLLAAMVTGLLHESRLVGYVEDKHPKLLRELAKRGKWLMPEDKNYSYAGVQWYLILRGEYKQIADPEAQRLGRKARACSFAAIACLALLGLTAITLHDFPRLKCLVPGV